MVLKKGSKGANVVILQMFLRIFDDGDFGSKTETAVKQWQKKNGLLDDGVVGRNTIKKMGIKLTDEFDTKYKGVTIQGSYFPDDPIEDNLRINLTKEIKEEYLPALNEAMWDVRTGLRLLCIIMAHKEGFKKGTRSYKTNNPGNIGNTDSGRDRSNSTLVDGVLLQKDYILSVVTGKHRAYMPGMKTIKPYYSPEIAKHSKLYGMSPYVPGYRFQYTGQLDEFVKIYSTGARGGNGYLSMIISYFKKNGFDIGAESKIQDIIKLD